MHKNRNITFICLIILPARNKFVPVNTSITFAKAYLSLSPNEIRLWLRILLCSLSCLTTPKTT
jgi:hypothetical protein